MITIRFKVLTSLTYIVNPFPNSGFRVHGNKAMVSRGLESNLCESISFQHRCLLVPCVQGTSQVEHDIKQ